MNDDLRAANDASLRAMFDSMMKREEKAETTKRLQAKQAPADKGGDAGDELVRGKVAGITGDEVFVDLEERHQGVLKRGEFDEEPAIGSEWEFTVADDSSELWALTRKRARMLETWDNLDMGKWVQAMVTGTNTGGLSLEVGPLRAFMPVSHIDTKRVEDTEAYVGQSMICQVIELERGDDRIVLSRRAVLEEERRRRREETVSTLAEGQVIHGTVEKVEPFGAFVSLGDGVSGLLHVSQMAHSRVEDPNTIVTVGQMVEVQVLKIDEDGRRIGLGMKQLQAHPWDGADRRWLPDMITSGRVTRIAAFGAFVELEPGVDGLVHVSQLAKQRVTRVQEFIKEGETVTVRILSVDPTDQRIALSRLTDRGELIGSDEDEAAREIAEESSHRVIRDSAIPQTGTNLGDLLRQAMDDKS